MKVVFAPGCTVRRRNPDAIALVKAQLDKIYGDVEVYPTCCRTKLKFEGEALVLSACSGCVNKFAKSYPQLTSRKLWDAIAEHPDVPFENEQEAREAIRAAYRKKQKTEATQV